MMQANTKAKVLFLVPYPLGYAPSQRFRVEMLLPLLEEAGIGYQLRPFLSASTWKILYKRGNIIQKIGGVVGGFLRRSYTILFEAPYYSLVFIHREAAPVGPPLFEWYVSKVLRKRLIYDFDDAVWIENTSGENHFAALLKCSWKVARISKWSDVVSAGNYYLKGFAERSGAAHTVYIPTVVDTTERYAAQKQHGSSKPVIGWTGSHSTLGYLDQVIPLIRQLNAELEFDFVVIADKDPKIALPNFRFIPWSPDTEIEDLLTIDIGLMPLIQDEWVEGKCGFKLIQYMALGIPAVASPVGVNTDIVEEGVNGFLCSTHEEWIRGLRMLITHPELRQDMGSAGRKTIVEKYSIEANKERFLGLFARV